MILCIETATVVCSASLCDEERVISVREAPQGESHAARLTVIIGSLLEEAAATAADLEAVAVSKGPGSYTGLRIAVSVAKGIAYGAGIPLIGINTLEAMCHGYLSASPLPPSSGTLLCPMIDARRMEVYNAVFRSDGTTIRETSADIINETSYSEMLETGKVIFFGNGAEKCREIIRHPNAVFEIPFPLSASYLHIPAVRALHDKQFEDVAYFEPYYLKEFIATVPGKLFP
ncbi:MAG: tRNA (adenosine(37)-N6)-threonylcarbamoyltransferase complex dimerization subunit type 1 TsaB [Bacteroidales bacterium]|nr:tRNA (adenosine(37)-N6)-threonylcarbamoyltransferase complex dimerization subunit type 1 TsaB [Bacteroidales bacterium]MDT8373600.1 tRNA (adenosine(37)-N6)-threonylcarbamoyltransferase complex dimerization subunit type 1 TsaB [Bacteroidales bacterium]